MNDVQPAGAISPFEIRIEDKTHVGADGTSIPAIRDLVLDLVPDSMTVLMGPSGCGKTTFLRIVAGLDDNYQGCVNLPEGARIGFVFQEPRLLPWRTVQQNIELVAAPGFTPADLERLAQAVGIADMLPRYPQELSLGLARRVALARAFATRPDLRSSTSRSFPSTSVRPTACAACFSRFGRRARPRRFSSPTTRAKRSCLPIS